MSGLKKSVKKAKERRARNQVATLEPLNPSFPFRVIPFDVEFFDIPANPPESFERQD